MLKLLMPPLTAGVLISTVQNPVSFDNFSSNGVQQVVGPYAKEKDAGTFCIPLNISAAGIDSLKDGSNVTVQVYSNKLNQGLLIQVSPQVVFAGGDGNLYQCADLTLVNNFTTTSDTSCKNESAAVTSASSTSTATSPSQTAGALGAAHITASYTAGALVFLGVVVALL
ncbi:hypothetical protein DXG01_000025 [Tephrocybe rancida]|nr:hypothetical protein DXG01_000025 [Tephrocybe rancida]